MVERSISWLPRQAELPVLSARQALMRETSWVVAASALRFFRRMSWWKSCLSILCKMLQSTTAILCQSLTRTAYLQVSKSVTCSLRRSAHGSSSLLMEIASRWEHVWKVSADLKRWFCRCGKTAAMSSFLQSFAIATIRIARTGETISTGSGDYDIVPTPAF